MSTDLFEVIRRNSIRQVKLVLEAGYDVNARNDRMETPLMACVMYVHDPECRSGLIKLLVSSGAELNLQNGRGQTVTMYGCILNQSDTVVQLLQHNNLDVDQTDSDGNTALMYACALGHYDSVKVILDADRAGQHNVDFRMKNFDGMSAIEHAAEGGHLDLVKLISGYLEMSETSSGHPGTHADVDWVEDKGPNPTPQPNHKPTPLNEKMQQFIQEVQEARVEDNAQTVPEVVPPSPCVGLASPSVIISGNEPYINVETLKGTDAKDKKSSDNRLRPSASPKPGGRPPSRSKHMRTAAQRTLEHYSDDEPELSLASLGELVTTVRECAKEIREICHYPEDGKESKKAMKAKGRGKKGKFEKSRNNPPDNDKNRRRRIHEEHVSKERKCSDDLNEDSIEQGCPKQSPSLNVHKSASNTTLHSDPVRKKTPSPTVSPLQGEPRDKSLLNEKQILDKVFCRLNNSRIVWGDEPVPGDNQPSPPQLPYNRASKATMLVRDQFSSYGTPLPGIHRPPNAALPPVRDGVRFRHIVHAQMHDGVHVHRGESGEGEGEDPRSDGEDGQEYCYMAT